MSRRGGALLAAAVLSGCAGAPRRIAVDPQRAALETWIAAERSSCVASLLSAASPTGTVVKTIDPASVLPERRSLASARMTVVPARGAVVAAPQSRPPAPDYFFHWVRDSALIMNALIDEESENSGPEITRRWNDFARFSRRLQNSYGADGEGEPRFNADGSLDVLKWSRPQYDGSALRALALLRARERPVDLDEDAANAADGAVKTDLDFLAANDPKGFDLWEEYLGRDFYAGAVQAAALDDGAQRMRELHDDRRAAAYSAARDGRLQRLEAHWNPDKARFGFAGGTRTYWDGTRRPKPGDDLDSAVLLAAVHAGRAFGPFSLLDDRVLSTWVQLEDAFAALYPVNRKRAPDEGVLLGRYPGDEYGGGNPWVLVTLAAAEADYGVAARLTRTSPYPVTALNREFLTRALKRADPSAAAPELGRDMTADRARLRALLVGLVGRGDDVLRAVMRRAPKSGGLPEQFDKTTGAPASASDLAWSCAALITATSRRYEAAQDAAR